MTKLDQMQAVEARAFAARKTVKHVCDVAGVYHSAWSRAKARQSVGVDMLQRMERALDRLEAQSAGEAQ